MVPSVQHATLIISRLSCLITVSLKTGIVLLDILPAGICTGLDTWPCEIHLWKATGLLRPLPQVGTHKHIVLTQHRHLPQGLVGESVEVVGTALPPAPALLPACMYQLLCKQEYNPDSQGVHSTLLAYQPMPLPPVPGRSCTTRTGFGEQGWL